MTPHYRKRFFLCIALTYLNGEITQCTLDNAHFPRLPHKNGEGHTWRKFKGQYEK